MTGRHQPAATAGQVAAHLDEHPDRERQHHRRPHPVERGQGGVRGDEDQEAEPDGCHRDRGDAVQRWGWLVMRAGQDARSSPSRARRQAAPHR